MSSTQAQSGTAAVNAELTIGDRQLAMRVTVPAGPTRLVEVLPIVQRIADKVVDAGVEDAEAQGRRVSCTKGCGACCRQLVPISEVEARWIRDVVENLPEPRRTRVRARFAEARARLSEAGLLDKLREREGWGEREFIDAGSEYFRLGVACPFLEDESCSIHAERPITCREYLVTSPASNCACPTKDNIQQVEMPMRVWTSLARFDMPDPEAKYIRWVPLVLAPEWAEAHPEPPPTRSGPQLLQAFFTSLAKKPAPAATAGAAPGAGPAKTAAPAPAASSSRPAPAATAVDNPTSYDDVPYESRAHYPTHPDRLAAVARMHGMRPAPPERCRMLELGCATGGNLLPMAELLPASRFLGIDLSPSQIARGRAVAAGVGLENLELRAASILDVDESYGQFDYITCHGVYSWVGEEVQRKILDICANHLAPQGVAYISYNTLPGWHVRGMVRDMLKFHARRFHDPATCVDQARAFLDFLVHSAAASEETYGALLKQEAELLRESEDYYLFHEHLEDVNQPLYFHQFAERIARHGLQYLGEAWYNTDLASFPPDVQQVLRQLSDERVTLEQYVDFLTNRTFRRSLICHAGVELAPQPPQAALAGTRLTALAKPAGQVDLASEAAAEFVTDAGRKVTTNIPLVKAALLSLFECWPAGISYDDLLSQSAARIAPETRQDRERDDALLAAHLAECCKAHAVAVHAWRPQIALAAGPRPRATRLARYQAAQGLPIVNLRHATVELDEADRAVLGCLDGEHDRAALAVRLRGQGGAAADAVSFSEATLEECLTRLAKSALLVE